MFKSLKNKKGLLWVAGALTMAEAIVLALAVAIPMAAVTKTSFREKKAVELCQSTTGGTLDVCKASVATLSKDAILAYIKDDAPGAPTNFANNDENTTGTN